MAARKTSLSTRRGRCEPSPLKCPDIPCPATHFPSPRHPPGALVISERKNTLTTSDSQTLRLRGPADLLAAVPYLLGFQPFESLVLVGLAGTRLVVTARIDLTDATLDMVADTVGVLRRSGATAVAGIVVTDHPDLTIDVRGHLYNAAERAELGVLDVPLVAGDQWYTLHGADPESLAQHGNPLPTGPTAVDAAAVYAGLAVLPSRDALANIFV